MPGGCHLFQSAFVGLAIDFGRADQLAGQAKTENTVGIHKTAPAFRRECAACVTDLFQPLTPDKSGQR